MRDVWRPKGPSRRDVCDTAARAAVVSNAVGRDVPGHAISAMEIGRLQWGKGGC